MSTQRDTAWYAEQRKFDGTWYPTIIRQAEKPESKTFTGRDRPVRNVQKLNFNGWDELTLDELHEHFNSIRPPEIGHLYAEVGVEHLFE